MLKYTLVSLCFFLSGFVICKGQPVVWQWSVSVRGSNKPLIPSRAYLWIPEHCSNLKGVIFAQNNMEEQSILENNKFRDSMSQLGIAEVWVSPGYDLMFDFSAGAGDVFESIMSDLANVSGYTELKTIPFIGLGHSAAASAPYYMAIWNPERALAAISVSGQWPFVRNTPFTPDIWKGRNLDYIPCLETMGEYEAANTWSVEGLKEREANPLMPLSMLACPAQGHFAATQEKINYIALYISKVVQYRIPKIGNKDKHLIPINPTKSGWLVDKWRLNQSPIANAATIHDYQGDPKEAFWFFDKELADSTVAFQARHRGKKAQLVGYIQESKFVEQRNTHQQVNLKFEPLSDGISFRVRGAFYDTVPAGSPRLTNWTGLPVGSHIDHSVNGDVSINVICGPVIKLNDSTFQVHPRAGYWLNPHSYELWFTASHEGDNEFKPAVQQSQMLIPFKNTNGKHQRINFPPIPDQHPGTTQVQLTATSDAGVPVYYYIQDGPAKIINDNSIELTGVPPKSTYPIKITVVAWQYGNTQGAGLQSADSVTRTFWIKKKQ